MGKTNNMFEQQQNYGLKLLKQMLGKQANFRSGQWEAIETLAIKKKRVLIVQRTGWGKSIVYFLAAKLLRENNAGPTLLISPLLSLMRNQIEMARRTGIQAETIHSANKADWEKIEDKLNHGQCDILLISPERLNNKHFQDKVLEEFSRNVGMLAVDEAHCISDWGHDFRPDYRRIARMIKYLPRDIPVLGTTATANNRVVKDIKAQFGEDLMVLRGPLVRTSLRLQNIQLETQAERLAWLIENIPLLAGSGIIYCMTIRDTERVTNWLRKNGVEAEAYHSQVRCGREELEQRLIENQLKILVATVALGMGFDKPDLGFVIHFQRPGSVVAYYQQVGRAGRALKKAYGILLGGREDDDIQEYFIKSAFPPGEIMLEILNTLDKSEGLKISQLQHYVNARQNVIINALKLLEVEGTVVKENSTYIRTIKPWKPNLERIDNITRQRYRELTQMQSYMEHRGCLMEYLERALDDPNPEPCGRCANCRGKGLPTFVKSKKIFHVSTQFLQNFEILLKPKKQFPMGVLPGVRKIPEEKLNRIGRALCYYGDPGLGKEVYEGKYSHNHFSDRLVKEAADLVTSRWAFYGEAPQWITAIPSMRRPHLVYDFAKRLSRELRLRFVPVFKRIRNVPEQKSMQNSVLQAKNVVSSLIIYEKAILHQQRVLLVDDIWDSGWTMTYAGWLLLEKQSGVVYPFTLGCTKG